MSPTLVAILGPTASGKSAVALALAQRLGGEIVSCDSMQVYRGLDIGTAKPTPAERQLVPHHLLDVLDLGEPCTAKRFRDLAEAAIREILARGRWPILCGGTGLYARALLYGLDLAPHDETLAAALRQGWEAPGGAAALAAELAQADPASVACAQGNPRRLLRALEILRLTGTPPSQLRTRQPLPDYVGPEFVLMPSPELTRRLVAPRTRAMLDGGWLEETAALVDRGLLASPTAGQALGYPEVAAYLRGEIATRAELEERLVTLTCRYARRQRTWFRHQHPRARVLALDQALSPAALAAELGAAVAAAG